MEAWFTKGGVEDKACDLILIQVLAESYGGYLLNYKNFKMSHIYLL